MKTKTKSTYFIYLASDEINDYYKFGKTDNLERRKNEYNATGTLRPVIFKKTFIFESKDDMDKRENKLSKELDKYIKVAQKNLKGHSASTQKEVFEVNNDSMNIFNRVMKGCTKYIIPPYNYEDFDHEQDVIDLINKYREEGLSDQVIEKLSIKTNAAYRKFTKRQIDDKRVHKIMKVNGKMLSYENKSSLAKRFNKVSKFKQELRLSLNEFYDTFEYDLRVVNTIKEYLKKGITEKEIEKIVLSYHIGYSKLDTDTKKERKKDLIKLNGKMIYWHNKDSISTRIKRYLNLKLLLQHELKKLK